MEVEKDLRKILDGFAEAEERACLALLPLTVPAHVNGSLPRLGYTVYHPMRARVRHEGGKTHLDIEQDVEIHFGEPPPTHGRVKKF